jgi:hypothetical protein
VIEPAVPLVRITCTPAVFTYDGSNHQNVPRGAAGYSEMFRCDIRAKADSQRSCFSIAPVCR